MASERILSIDGGGVRGIIPTVILQRLSEEPGLDDWLERVDFVAGTSTGGILALALAAGLDLDTIRVLYEQRARHVFADSFWDNIFDLGKILGADYDIDNLRRETQAVFGDRRLADLEKRVLVTTFDLKDDAAEAAPTWKPKIFHNFRGSDSDGEELAYKVATYTSAAPTYFQSEDGYIDGGVFASNPAMCALAQTQDLRNAPEDRAELRDVRLLSLGTGRSLECVEGERLDWGYAQWVRPLVSLMLDGTSGIADYQCQQILGEERYHRLGPTLPADHPIAMDGVQDIAFMVDFAMQVRIDEAADWLRAHW